MRLVAGGADHRDDPPGGALVSRVAPARTVTPYLPLDFAGHRSEFPAEALFFHMQTYATFPLPPPAPVKQVHDKGTELREKIAMILLEKLLLAMLVAAAGWWVSFELEHYKAVESRYSELAKRSIQAVDNIWQSISTLQSLSTQIRDQLVHDPTGLSKHPAVPQFKEELKKSTQLLEANAIWLPEEDEKALRDYIATLRDFTLQSSPKAAESLPLRFRELRNRILHSPELK